MKATLILVPGAIVLGMVSSLFELNSPWVVTSVWTVIAVGFILLLTGPRIRRQMRRSRERGLVAWQPQYWAGFWDPNGADGPHDAVEIEIHDAL